MAYRIGILAAHELVTDSKLLVRPNGTNTGNNSTLEHSGPSWREQGPVERRLTTHHTNLSLRYTAEGVNRALQLGSHGNGVWFGAS